MYKYGLLVLGLVAAVFVAQASNSSDEAANSLQAETPFSIAGGQGVFLIITDIHFDPFADTDIVKKLAAAPVRQWQSILETSTQTGFAQYGTDSNYPLMVSALNAARDAAESGGFGYDFILYPGDFLAHNFISNFQRYVGGGDQALQSFVIKTMEFVNLMFEQTFGAVPVYGALGNNDAICGNYMIAPDSAMLPAVGKEWSVLQNNPEAYETFSLSGSYALPHPTVPDHKLIVLNDIFWSIKYQDSCGPQDVDPGAAQLAWLEWMLYKARLMDQNVSLIMHIPPGINAYSSSQGSMCRSNVTRFWQEKYETPFLNLIQSYKDVLRNSYAGHTHMDDFRVASDTNGTPFLLTHISPSVSPIFNNNPAFAMVLYDQPSGDLIDYASFYLTNLASAGSSEAANWSIEYTFSGAYNFDTYSPTDLQALAGQIQNDADVRDSYIEYYAAETPAGSPINQQNWKAYACAQTELTADGFANCYCGPGEERALPGN